MAWRRKVYDIPVLSCSVHHIGNRARCRAPTMAGRMPGRLSNPNNQADSPNPAGGLPDTVSRLVGRRLQERLEQSVVVENRPGANGRVAVAALLNAAADGYTLLVTDGAIISINPLLFSN